MLTRVLLGVGLTLTPLAAALAQSLCPATYWECLPGEDGQPHCEPVADQPREAQPVLLSADRIEGSNNENYVLRGDARAERADQQLRADELSYNVPGEILRATAADGRPGHPVLFGRRFFGQLAALKGDRGARSVIAA